MHYDIPAIRQIVQKSLEKDPKAGGETFARAMNEAGMTRRDGKPVTPSDARNLVSKYFGSLRVIRQTGTIKKKRRRTSVRAETPVLASVKKAPVKKTSKKAISQLLAAITEAPISWEQKEAMIQIIYEHTGVKS
jgi:hypothetical protein